MSDLLRAFVRGALNEAAITADGAVSSGIGLWIDHDMESEGMKMAVLYNSGLASTKLAELLTTLDADSEGELDVWELFQDVMDETVIGMVRLAKNDGDCYGSWQVANIAAEKGNGPLLYDVAFSLVKGNTLTPDRKNVTGKARAVWDRMKSSGKTVHASVEAMPLDNIDDPQTPPPQDDCKLHPDDPKSPLNFAYKAKNPLDIKPLLANHDKLQEWLMANLQRHFIDDRSMARALHASANLYFSHKYWQEISA